MQQYGFPEAISAERVHSLNDDEIIDLGRGLTMRTVWTPGHASHHLSFLLESSRTLFTGDCVGVYWPDLPVLIPTTPPPSFNLEKALASLSRVRALKSSEFCTPHFGVIRNPETWLNVNKQKLLEWKETIARMVAVGNSADSIAEMLISQLNKIHRLPTQLPEHLRTLIQVDAVGFVRWLQYSKVSD